MRDGLDVRVERAEILVEVGHLERGEHRGVIAVREENPILEVFVRRLRPFGLQSAEHRGVHARDVGVEVRNVRPDDVRRSVVVEFVLVILDPRADFRVHVGHVIRRRGGFELGINRVEVGIERGDARRPHRAVPRTGNPLLQRVVRVNNPLRVHRRQDDGVDSLEVGRVAVD